MDRGREERDTWQDEGKENFCSKRESLVFLWLVIFSFDFVDYAGHDVHFSVNCWPSITNLYRE
jgi:hypothetical protein